MAAARNAQTGRFTRVDMRAEHADDSEFGTVAQDGLDVENISGAASPNTIDEPRYAPAVPEGERPPLRPRRPELVSMDEHAATRYSVQGGRLRDAAREAGITAGPIAYMLGVDDSDGPGDAQDGTDRRRQG